MIAHARQSRLPVDVLGDVEWLLNRTATGRLLTLLNPAGINNPQHGIVPTDYAQERDVTIQSIPRMTTTNEWFTRESLVITANSNANRVTLTIPAGGQRIVELRE